MRQVLLLTLVVIASVNALAQQPVYERGQLVRVRPIADRPDLSAPAFPLVVVGVPGDRVRADMGVIYVNDQVVTGFSPEFIRRMAESPELLPGVVPDGHYFLMAEQRTNNDISEYWGQHSGSRLTLFVRVSIQ